MLETLFLPGATRKAQKDPFENPADVAMHVRGCEEDAE